MRLPLRLRLTLAFACGMAIVLSALGAFLYASPRRSSCSRSIDMGLRSRAETIVAGLDAEAARSRTTGDLIDPDERSRRC
jgi:hypothetical protein